MTMDRTRAAGSQSRPAGSWPRFAGALRRPGGHRRRHPDRSDRRQPDRARARRNHCRASARGTTSVRGSRPNAPPPRSPASRCASCCRCAWLLWAALLVSVVSSLVASRPKLEHVHIPRLAMFDGLGAWIVAGLLVFGSLTPKVAAASPPARQAAATAFATRTTTASRRRPDLTVAAPTQAGLGRRPSRPSRSRCSPRAPSATPTVGPKSGSSTKAGRWTRPARRGPKPGD